MAKNMCLPPTDKTVLLMLTLPKWNLFSAFDDDIFHQLEIWLFQYHALSVCLSVCRATIPHDYPIKICVLRKCVAYTYLMMDKSTTMIIIIEWYFASIQEVGWSCVCAWQIVLKFWCAFAKSRVHKIGCVDSFVCTVYATYVALASWCACVPWCTRAAVYDCRGVLLDMQVVICAVIWIISMHRQVFRYIILAFKFLIWNAKAMGSHAKLLFFYIHDL